MEVIHGYYQHMLVHQARTVGPVQKKGGTAARVEQSRRQARQGRRSLGAIGPTWRAHHGRNARPGQYQDNAVVMAVQLVQLPS